jgi:hypothetical protein
MYQAKNYYILCINGFILSQNRNFLPFYAKIFLKEVKNQALSWQRCLEVSYPPATKETGARGHKIESRQ